MRGRQGIHAQKHGGNLLKRAALSASKAAHLLQDSREILLIDRQAGAGVGKALFAGHKRRILKDEMPFPGQRPPPLQPHFVMRSPQICVQHSSLSHSEKCRCRPSAGNLS